MPLKLTRRKGSAVWHIAGSFGGQRVRESTGTADKRLAEEARAAREVAIHRAAVFGPTAVRSWAEAVNRYAEVTSPSTGTAALLLRITRHFGATTLLKDIDQDRVDRAIRVLCEPDAAPATKLRNVIGPIRAVMTLAARRGWCGAPLFEVPEGSSGVRRTRWLTPDEFHRLTAAAAPHLRPLVVFLVATGARLSEALRLVWDDVDLLHARATLRDTKNGRDRTVDLPPAAVAALSAMRNDREAEVFRTHHGEVYADRDGFGGQIKKAWATAARRAGFAGEWHEDAQGGRWWTPLDVTPHILRHSYASWHYAMHRDLLRLKHDGDWSSVSLVERYAKLAPATMADGIRAALGLSFSDTPQTQSTPLRVTSA